MWGAGKDDSCGPAKNSSEPEQAMATTVYPNSWHRGTLVLGHNVPLGVCRLTGDKLGETSGWGRVTTLTLIFCLHPERSHRLWKPPVVTPI